jgi:carbamoyl-phosphate synthase large subunit
MNFLFSCIGKRGYVARSFRPHLQSGDRIIGTSNTRWTPGFHSCDRGYVMPDIASPSYIPAVLELCKRERIQGLLSFFDLDVQRLSEYRDELRSLGVKCFIPGLEAADICLDKLQTYYFLKEHGFNTAETYTDLAKAKAALEDGRLKYPVYVKPRFGFASRNTFQARNERELDVFFALEADMLVQEALGGEAYDFDILNDLDGKVLSVVPWRKSLSRMGETEQAETVDSPQLVELGTKLATALGHAGPLDADLFLWNGKAYVLEINLRFGGGYPVSHLAGADFPAMVVAMARGEKPAARIGEYRRGIVMMKDLQILGGPAAGFFEREVRVDDSLCRSSAEKAP